MSELNRQNQTPNVNPNEEDYGDLGEKRNRRVRVIAWTVIVALILAGGGATVLTLILG